MNVIDMMRTFSASADGTIYAFYGDNNAYVQLASDIDIGTTHDIEFDCMFNNAFNDRLCGTLNSYIGSIAGGTLRYRVGGNNLNWVGLTFDEWHVYKFVRSELNVELFIDDVSQGSQVLPVNSTFVVGRIFTYEGTAINFNGALKYIDFNTDNIYSFSPPSTVLNDGPVSGTIINDDGNRIQEV